MKHRLQLLITLPIIPLLTALSGCDSLVKEGVGTSVVRQKLETKPARKIDFSSVVTVGNRSYLPLNLLGNASENHQTILDVLKKFEDEKKMEITNWKVSERQTSTTSAFTYGLWIDHKAR
jgi:hypothetical protein